MGHLRPATVINPDYDLGPTDRGRGIEKALRIGLVSSQQEAAASPFKGMISGGRLNVSLEELLPL